MVDDLTRRDAMMIAVALTAAAILPMASDSRPEFAAMCEDVNKAVATFRQARIASRLARPRIFNEMRTRGIGCFFQAPEIRARSRARHEAQAAVEALCRTVAANEREAQCQEAALSIYENELGGSIGFRDRFPPTQFVNAQLHSAPDELPRTRRSHDKERA